MDNEIALYSGTTGKLLKRATQTGVVRADSGVISVDTDVTDLVTAASDTAAGKVELATTAETTTGTDATRAVTPDGLHDMTSIAGAAWIVDEDAMGSNLDTKLPTQQSVKAYADTKQTSHGNLTALAGLTGVADRVAYFTGAAAMALATLTSYGRSLIAAADAAAAKTLLALVKGDVGLGNVDNTSDATKQAATLANVITQSVVIPFGNGTDVITVGEKRRFDIPVAATLVRWRIWSSVSGSITFSIWRDTFAAIPVAADEISTSRPTLTAAVTAEDSSITDWSEVGGAGDLYLANVESVATCTDVVLILYYTRALNV